MFLDNQDLSVWMCFVGIGGLGFVAFKFPESFRVPSIVHSGTDRDAYVYILADIWGGWGQLL